MGTSTPTLARIVGTIGELPASPAVVSAVMSLTSDLNSTIGDITRVLSADQSLTAKVLRLSNSSFFGRAKEVGTLAEAIIILGFFTVRSLVVASSAHSMYSRCPLTDRKYTVQLWQHSLATGLAARQIAERVSPGEAEEAFIAGLLHDIGKLVLMQKLNDSYLEIIETTQKNNADFLALERRQLGFDHSDVGRALVDQWAFPSQLLAAVANHHDTRAAHGSAITSAVQLGNCLSRRLDLGFCSTTRSVPEKHPAAHALGLGSDEIAAILDSVREQYKTEARLFDDV